MTMLLDTNLGDTAVANTDGKGLSNMASLENGLLEPCGWNGLLEP